MRGITISKYLSTLLFGLGLMAIEGAAQDVPEMSPSLEKQTHITSNSLEVDNSKPEFTRFLFKGNVLITSPGITANCDQMEVTSIRQDPSKDITDSLGNIDKIVATGNVEITENERTAKAGRAEIYPSEGKVILMENPIVQDVEGIVTGHQITLYRDQRRAVVEGLPGQERPTVTLPSLSTFDPKSSEQTPEDNEAESE